MFLSEIYVRWADSLPAAGYEPVKFSVCLAEAWQSRGACCWWWGSRRVLQEEEGGGGGVDSISVLATPLIPNISLNTMINGFESWVSS